MASLFRVDRVPRDFRKCMWTEIRLEFKFCTDARPFHQSSWGTGCRGPALTHCYAAPGRWFETNSEGGSRGGLFACSDHGRLFVGGDPEYDKIIVRLWRCSPRILRRQSLGSLAHHPVRLKGVPCMTLSSRAGYDPAPSPTHMLRFHQPQIGTPLTVPISMVSSR